jgi:hypothetical protein
MLKNKDKNNLLPVLPVLPVWVMWVKACFFTRFTPPYLSKGVKRVSRWVKPRSSPVAQAVGIETGKLERGEKCDSVR